MKYLYYFLFYILIFFGYISIWQTDSIFNDLNGFVWQNDFFDLSFANQKLESFDKYNSYISVSITADGLYSEDIQLGIWNLGIKKLSERWSVTTSSDEDKETIFIQNIAIPRSDLDSIVLNIDPTNQIDEKNETNNSIKVNIKALEKKLDLYISDIVYDKNANILEVNTCISEAEKTTNFDTTIDIWWKNKTLQQNISQWCQIVSFDMTQKEFANMKKWNYEIIWYIDINGKLDESDKKNNKLKKNIYLEFGEVELPDIYIDKISFDEENKQIISSICVTKWQDVWTKKINITVSIGGKDYNIAKNMDLSKDNCVKYNLDIEKDIEDGYYTVYTKINQDIDEKTYNNNANSFGFELKQNTNTENQKPTDILNSGFDTSWYIVSNYDILTTYCEFEYDFVSKCSKLYELEALRQSIHIVFANMIWYFDSKKYKPDEILSDIDFFRKSIWELQKTFSDDDYKVQVRISFIFAYIDYGLSLYSKWLEKQIYENTKSDLDSIKKFFIMF